MSMKRNLLMLPVLIGQNLVFAEPFEIAAFKGNIGTDPVQVSSNMTSSQGREYVKHPNHSLLVNLEEEAQQGRAQACFDMGVIYFLGIGVDRNNQTASKYFLKSYELEDQFRVGYENAAEINLGPVRRKSVEDLEIAVLRTIDSHLMGWRDSLLSFHSWLKRFFS